MISTIPINEARQGDPQQSILISFATSYYEDVYLNTDFSDETDIAGVESGSVSEDHTVLTKGKDQNECIGRLFDVRIIMSWRLCMWCGSNINHYLDTSFNKQTKH